MKKGRKINRLISFLEVLVMVLCFTVPVSAETVPAEAATMAELQTAIADKAECIKLTADIDVDQILWFDYSVTLDGDGHALNRSEGFGDVILLFTGEEALVKNLTVDGKDCADGFWSHDLSFEDITLNSVPSAAMVGHENTVLTMENCTVCNNTCPDNEGYSGVRGVFSYNILKMTGCRICDNEVGLEIYPFDYEKPVSTSLTITDSIIENNLWEGIYAEGETRLCGSTIIRNNGNMDSGWWGGGIYQWTGSMDIGEDCIITGNIAGYGGGIAADNVSLALKGSCFGNTATIAGDDIYIDRYPEGEESVIPEVSMDICETQKPMLFGPSGTEEPVEGYPADEKHQVLVPFYGWFEDFEDARFTSVDESVKISEENDNLELLNGEIAGLKAVWDGVFLVYDKNNGTGEYQYADNAFEAGAEAVLADNMFEKPGYLFVEWNTSPEGSGESYQPGNTLTMDEDTVLYAIWQKGYVMTYLPGADGVTNLPEADVVDDKTTYVVDSTIPQREGYEFIDWTLDYGIVDKVPVVVYYRNMVTNEMIQRPDNYLCSIGESLTLEAPDLTDQGYIYKRADALGQELIDADEVTIEASADSNDNVVTFWYNITHTVTYVISDNGRPEGVETPPPVVVEHGSDLELVDPCTFYQEPTEFMDTEEEITIHCLSLYEGEFLSYTYTGRPGDTIILNAPTKKGYVVFGPSQVEFDVLPTWTMQTLFRGWGRSYDEYGYGVSDPIEGNKLENITEDITVYGDWETLFTPNGDSNEYYFFYTQNLVG